MTQTFEELISAELDALYSAALCFTQDDHQAEDLLQESAIRAFHEFRSGRPKSDVRVWMLGKLVTTYLRRERLRGADPLSETLEAMGDMVSTVADVVGVSFPEPGTRAHERLRSWLDQAWPEVDPGDRLVLWLSAVERLRPARVAQMLELDEEQVRRRHYRARRGLSSGALRRIAEGRLGGAEA